jgi:hypothetical protein
MFLALAEAASSLGWAAMVTTIFQEIRLIGFACLGGAIIVAGIELLFHRHLERLGIVIASLGVGGGLIVGGATAALALTGGAGATGAPFVHVVGLDEAIGTMIGELLYYGLLLGTLMTLWREGARHGQH